MPPSTCAEPINWRRHGQLHRQPHQREREPRKLTRARRRVIVACLGAGLAQAQAARAAGVSRRTLGRWLKQGREGVGLRQTKLWREVCEADREESGRWLRRRLSCRLAGSTTR